MALHSQRAKQWLDRLNASNHMLWLLGVISFLETIIIPIPIEVVLIPLLAVNRDRVWVIATVAMTGCLIASLVGYGVGMVLFQSIGVWFIDAMGMQDAYAAFQAFFDEHGFIAIITLGILPIPFQVAMITAGLSGYPVQLFVLAAVISRGIRYFGLAWLVLKFGERAQTLWQRHALVTSIVAAALVLGFSLGMRALAGMVM
ncbi:MAG: VTT domain-containing protein [Pseudohongiella sp.]